MVRWFLICLAVFAICALPASAAKGGGSQQLSFYLHERHIAQPVDYLTWCGDCIGVDYHSGTPWVVNPSTCLWDSDDFFTYWSLGGQTLESGATTTINECTYALGGSFHELGIFIHSPSPDLRVTETWSWNGGQVSTQTSPTWDAASGLWYYFDCIQAPFALAPTVLIPGSNGGFALPQSETITVSNPTGRKVMKTYGMVSSDYAHGTIQSFGCLTFRTP